MASETPTLTQTPVPTSTKTATLTLIPSATSTQTRTPSLTQVSEKDGMVQVYVPAGEFEMGSNDGDSDQKPVHTVYLDTYWIDQTEVTNAMYALCVEDGDCEKPISDYFDDTNFTDHPVVNVSWYAAEDYCTWAGRELPTEAQWEKAARGTDGRIYPWGNAAPDCILANYSGCTGNTLEVGSLQAGASPFGVLDMAGNVCEWVADWYAADYYSVSPKNNPTGPANGNYRVLRGGSWFDYESFLRSADRLGIYPVYTYDSSGFRCVVSLP